MPLSLENTLFFYLHSSNPSLKSSLLYHFSLPSPHSLQCIALSWDFSFPMIAASGNSVYPPHTFFFFGHGSFTTVHPFLNGWWEVAMRSGFGLWAETLSNTEGSLRWDVKLRNKNLKDSRKRHGRKYKQTHPRHFFLDFLCFSLASFFFFFSMFV